MITERASEFAAALDDGGVLIGIDPGTKRIGTATCDAGWHFATAGPVIARTKFAATREALAKVIAARRVCGMVLGLPRNMDGSEGPRAQATRALARNLQEAFDLPILLWDERLSSASADMAMIAQGTSRAKRSERIDSHAASVILQAAIDALTSPMLGASER